MAVWPESGKIGIDLSSMLVNEVIGVDLTVYGGAGAGHGSTPTTELRFQVNDLLLPKRS